MPDTKSYRLTGGVFFLLISRGLKKKRKTEVDCLAALASIFDGSKKYVARKTMRSNTTQYKKCELDNSMFLPFGDEDLVEKFRSRLEHNYDSVLAEMAAFVEEYVPKSEYSWLVSAIDEILQADGSAKESVFYVLSSGEPVSYQELLDETEFEIEPFLTGIWGFILTERPYNTDGAATFHALTREAATKGNPRIFVSDIGNILHKKAESMNPGNDGGIRQRFIMPGSSIAPELTPDGELYLVEEIEAEEESEYDEYFSRLKKAYNKITTLLYADTPQPFYDFYICNDIYRFEAGRKRQMISIENVTAGALLEHSNYVLLSGNGGLGKSMMMRHLLLDCINRYEEVGLLPIFLELRTYTETTESLSDYAYRLFAKNGGKKSRTEFDELLKSGDILLLCDGLDEVQSEKRKRFQDELEEFTGTYPECVIVISSRPFGPFGSYASMRRFTVFYLKTFSEKQAMALVEKLKFHEDKPAIKQNFLKALKGLYWSSSHHSFAENPLLLTIMMMMYAEIGDVPSKMHLFYNEAFQVLARKHDATKGGYKRPLATNLDIEVFKEVFSEFCARTYNDERVELTEEQMESYYDQLKVARTSNGNWSYESFAADLTSNLCLMYFESLKYHFVHRSFQEYFCARYLSKRLDKNLYKLAQTFFESKHLRYYSDNTFDMLYDMIPDRIEENVFIPFLKSLLEKCDQGEGFVTFLKEMYPEISYNHGTVASEYETEAKSFLYKFITREAVIYESVENSEFPLESDFIEERYVELDEEWLERNDSPDDTIVRAQDVEDAYIREMGEPDEVGYNLAFDVATVLEDPDSYPEVAKRLFSSDFSLRKEYEAVREYFDTLSEKYSEQEDEEDVFDLL